MRQSSHEMRFDLWCQIWFSFQINCVVEEIWMKLPSWYFVKLQRFNPLSESVFDVTQAFNVEKVSLIMVDGKADLASVCVFG